MTLRDYFAAMALQGLVTAGANRDNVSVELFRRIAACSYGLADAMLAERERVDNIPE